MQKPNGTGLRHQEARSISHALSTSDLTDSIVWSRFKCQSHCMHSASTHHWYHWPVRSRDSYEQRYSCSWRLRLCFSPLHRDPPSRWLEETTWLPSQGVGSTDWWRLCVRHSAHPTSCDRSQPRNKISATGLRCPCVLKEQRKVVVNQIKGRKLTTQTLNNHYNWLTNICKQN